MQAGVNSLLVVYGFVVFLWLLFVVLEQLMPYRKAWNQPDGDVANDVISALVAYLFIPLLLKPFYIIAILSIASLVSTSVGSDIWPHDWPMWTQLALMLLAGDAGRYWGHRAAHEIPILWRFHAIHHSPNRLWFFNGMRQHPVDKLVFMASELLFPVLLGASGEVLGLYLLATAICGYFQHTNMDVKLGPFYYIFNIVDLHRWHHSQCIEESNNNYGNNLIVYDILFGTRYLPSDKAVDEIGLLNPDYPKSYLGQLVAPFKRERLDKLAQGPETASSKP